MGEGRLSGQTRQALAANPEAHYSLEELSIAEAYVELPKDMQERLARGEGFDPAAEHFFGSTAIPSGGGAIRHMVFHAPTRSIWFGADTNTLGRAKLP